MQFRYETALNLNLPRTGVCDRTWDPQYNCNSIYVHSHIQLCYSYSFVIRFVRRRLKHLYVIFKIFSTYTS